MLIHDHLEELQILQRILSRSLDLRPLSDARMQLLQLEGISILVAGLNAAMSLVAMLVELVNLDSDAQPLDERSVVAYRHRLVLTIDGQMGIESRDVVDAGLVVTSEWLSTWRVVLVVEHDHVPMCRVAGLQRRPLADDLGRLA